ncbi:hypothetical protein ABTZ57_42605 [Streptomyces sp. NPDC094048]|uniref:hypothetical protein n=1 Tax=Streptomyces sp. NPDC094048 TaxID=3155207 RepID=UPI0033191399
MTGPLHGGPAPLLDAHDSTGPEKPPADPARRIVVPDVTCRSTWDAVPSGVREGVQSAAAKERARPAPRLLATAWARAFRDGSRSAYEDRAWALQERVSLLVPAAVLTGELAASSAASGDRPHPDAAVDGLVAFAEATTWCRAPRDRVTAAREDVAPDPDDPFLDLGAAEVAALFAWADHVLGSHLDRRMPGLRASVEHRALDDPQLRRSWGARLSRLARRSDSPPPRGGSPCDGNETVKRGLPQHS